MYLAQIEYEFYYTSVMFSISLINWAKDKCDAIVSGLNIFYCHLRDIAYRFEIWRPFEI